MKRRREILIPASARQDIRPIRSETRAALVAAIARGRQWLDKVIELPQTRSRLRREKNAPFGRST
jgi:acetyl-CoA carboxylase carboxyltransferase component